MSQDFARVEDRKSYDAGYRWELVIGDVFRVEYQFHHEAGKHMKAINIAHRAAVKAEVEKWERIAAERLGMIRKLADEAS